MLKTLVEFKNVTFGWNQKVVIKQINLQIPKGKIVAIMGPSGTGKTTLLRLIGGEILPQKGRVIVDNQTIHELSTAELYALRRKMGVLFQTAALFTNYSVFENIAFPYREHTNLNEDTITDLVLMKLEAVGLRGAKHLMPSQLSGGMARRVALARALALDPQLMLYDEPFVGQDPISTAVIAKLIKELNHILDMTSIIVSHDVREALSIVDYVYILSDGGVVGEGEPSHILQSKEPHIDQFIHGRPDGVFPFHYPAKEITKEIL